MTGKKKKSTPSFIVTRQIRDIKDAFFIEHKLDIANSIYNKTLTHFKKHMDDLYHDMWYQKCYTRMKKESDEEKKKEWVSEIAECVALYGLTEYDIHSYLTKLRNTSFRNALNSAIMQKLGSSLYASVKKAVYHQTRLHYRKYKQTVSLSGKQNTTGIVYKMKEDAVSFMGHTYSLKPIREKDYWLQEAMTHRVKYCCIVKKHIHGKAKYFLQLVMEGLSPKKFQKGTGNCGLDEGTSTIAYSSDKENGFYVLAEGIEKYEKDIKKYNVMYDRRRRLANPQCYEKNGTIKKGSRFTNQTKGMQKALFLLKSAYQKKKTFIRNKHGYLANKIIQQCDCIIKEPMNFKALARRAKGSSKKQDKLSLIKNKSGKKKLVRKWKRKKRFGKSIQRRSPGLFNSILEQKCSQYDILLVDVDIKKYRASQYDHSRNVYIKSGLTERSKKIGGHRVQRDMYSAFLLKNIKDITSPDRKKCMIDFRNFLKKQGKVVNSMRKKGDKTGNFGLQYFIS